MNEPVEMNICREIVEKAARKMRLEQRKISWLRLESKISQEGAIEASVHYSDEGGTEIIPEKGIPSKYQSGEHKLLTNRLNALAEYIGRPGIAKILGGENIDLVVSSESKRGPAFIQAEFMYDGKHYT